MPEELVTQDAAEVESILAQQNAQFKNDTIRTPILKVGQPLTKEVTAGDAVPGEFINTLLGEGLGDQVEFIISFYNEGRFAVDPKTDRTYVAFGETIPEGWADFVGEEFVGTLFSEYPDAEEAFKKAVNAKEREWGSGAPISTTHNYTGYVKEPVLEDAEDEENWLPVRLSLKRTDMDGVRKINTIKQAALRNKPFWENVWILRTKSKEFRKGTAYLVDPKLGRKTTSDEKALAVELAQAVIQQRVASNDAAVVDEPTDPGNNGGLDVS